MIRVITNHPELASNDDTQIRFGNDDIKEKDYVDGKLFYELVEDMVKDEKCDAVILGCTELSLAQEREPITDLPIIDSQSVLVDKTLELALKTQKNK